MFGWANGRPTQLERTIAELHSDMRGVNPESDEYKLYLSQLERLHALKDQESKRRISPDTLAIVVGNLVGILIIVKFERGAVMVSKAKDYVLKTK